MLLPGHIFFVENLELPPALSDSEIADFAELSIESIAPFPIEHLNWGFYHAPQTQNIIIYAAHRDRITASGYEELEKYAWVLPDFFSLMGARFTEETEILLQSEHSISLLRFNIGSGTPTAIAAQANSDWAIENSIEVLRSELGGRPNEYDPILMDLPTIEIDEHLIPTFRHQIAENGNSYPPYGEWQVLSPSEDDLWRADIRSGSFKNSERSTRKTGALLSRITAWAGFAIILLIGLELILLTAQIWLGSKENKIAQQAPQVAKIEDRQSLMNKLEQVAQNELRPIAILEALNTIRPDGIYFTSTSAEDGNRISIDGIANTITEFNNYTESLRKSGLFELIGTPKSITRGGKTTFTVTMDYFHKENPAPDNGVTTTEGGDI